MSVLIFTAKPRFFFVSAKYAGMLEGLAPAEVDAVLPD